MFPLLLVLLLPLLCTEAVNVQDSFAEAGLVNDLMILAPGKQLEVMPIECHPMEHIQQAMVIMVYLAQVSYPGLYPLAPGDGLAVSEAREVPSIRLEEASKEQLYTVGRFASSPYNISPQLFNTQPWSTQMHHRGKTRGQPSGFTGSSPMLKVGKRSKTSLNSSLHFLLRQVDG